MSAAAVAEPPTQSEMVPSQNSENFVLPFQSGQASEPAPESAPPAPPAEQFADMEPGQVIDAGYTVNGKEVPSDPPVLTLPPREQLEADIRDQEHQVAEAAMDVGRISAQLKRAKKEFNEEVEYLAEMQARLERGQYDLPQSPTLESRLVSPESHLPASATAPLPGQMDLPLEKPAEDESWKQWPLTGIDLPNGIVKALAEAGLNTMGDLATFTAEKPLTMIDGIGEGKAAKIEEATLRFWEMRKAGQTTPAQVPPGATSTTTPAGIAANDPDAARLEAEGQHEREQAEEAMNADRTAAATEHGAETAEETESYAKGCEACIEGRPVSDNPHRKGTRLYKFWDRGWQDVNNEPDADEPLGDEHDPNVED